jgi:hypothetical protein
MRHKPRTNLSKKGQICKFFEGFKPVYPVYPVYFFNYLPLEAAEESFNKINLPSRSQRALIEVIRRFKWFQLFFGTSQPAFLPQNPLKIVLFRAVFRTLWPKSWIEVRVGRIEDDLASGKPSASLPSQCWESI